MENEHGKKVKTGIHWSYRDVLRHQSGAILAACLVLAVALAAGYSVVAAMTDAPDTRLTALLANLAQDVMSLKANGIAIDVAAALMVMTPVALALWLLFAGLLTLYYNARDRDVEVTEDNLRYHEAEMRFAWTWPWSFLFGVFDFTAAFSLLTILQGLVMPNISKQGLAFYTALATLVCLVFAERRVTRLSMGMASRLRGNVEVINAILDGDVDDMLPESLRSDYGRSKVATVVSRGIMRSPYWASLVVKGIGLRTKVKLFSGFLNSSIHGVLTAISLGIAATAANSLGAVGGQFADGKGEAYMDSLRNPETLPPHFFIEVVSIAIVAVIAILYFAGVIQ